MLKGKILQSPILQEINVFAVIKFHVPQAKKRLLNFHETTPIICVLKYFRLSMVC
jgi:hypothetical protein